MNPEERIEFARRLQTEGSIRNSEVHFRCKDGTEKVGLAFELRGGSGEIDLAISDRGTGFDQTEALSSRGLGLISYAGEVALGERSLGDRVPTRTWDDDPSTCSDQDRRGGACPSPNNRIATAMLSRDLSGQIVVSFLRLEKHLFRFLLEQTISCVL
jgi:hypothetical protein